MKTRALILSSLLALSGRAQDILWDTVNWGSGEAKVIAVSGNKWLVPAAAGAAVIGVGAVFLLPEDEDTPQPETPAKECNLVFTASSIPAICSASTGGAAISPSDAIIADAIWPDETNAFNRDDLAAGVYQVIVRYGACTDTLHIEITADIIPLELTIADSSPPTEENATDGSATIEVNNPLHPPFVFNVNGVDFPEQSDVFFTAESLGFGNHLIAVTDAFGCTGTIEVEFEFIDPCDTEFTATTSTSACITPTGGAQIEAIDGTVFTATWPDGLITSDRNDLFPGDYLVTIEYDECSEILPITIVSENIPVQLNLADITHPSGPFTSDGSFFAEALPPAVGPFFFNLNGLVFPATPEPVFAAENLSEGNYLLTVTDGQGCTGSIAVVLTSASGLVDPGDWKPVPPERKRMRQFAWVFTPIFRKAPLNAPR